MYIARYTDKYLPGSNAWETINREESVTTSTMQAAVSTMVRTLLRRGSAFDIHVDSSGAFGTVLIRDRDTKYTHRTRVIFKQNRATIPENMAERTYETKAVTAIGR